MEETEPQITEPPVQCNTGGGVELGNLMKLGTYHVIVNGWF